MVNQSRPNQSAYAFPTSLAYWIELVVGFRTRQRSRIRTHKRRAAAASVLKVVDGYFEKLDGLEAAAGRTLLHTRTLHNVALYVLLLNRDLIEFSGDMVAAIGDFRRKFVARHTAVLLTEAAEDIPELIGGKYRSSLRSLGVLHGLQGELNSISGGFNLFRRTHWVLLTTIRNSVAAHRDKDALRQARIMEEINPMDIQSLAAEFSVPLNHLVRFQTEVLRQASDVRGLLRDLGSV